jgi:hypothetical protein
MTIPREWPFPTKEKFLEDPVTYLQDMYAALADEIAAPNWKLQDTVAVGAGALSLAVAVAIDRLPAEVLVSTDWGTATWITALSTTGFTVNFGIAVPGGGGHVSYVVIVPEAGPA